MSELVNGTIEKLREAMARVSDVVDGVKQTSKVHIVIGTEIDTDVPDKKILAGTPRYSILKNGEVLLYKNQNEFWTFKQLIDKTIDFFGYEERARQYLQEALVKFAKQHSVAPSKMQIRAVTGDDNDYPRPVPYLFKYNEDHKAFVPVKQISFGPDIFNEM